jgi:hypothetical protein
MTPSLDDPIFQGGVPLLLAVNAADEIGTMQGDNLEANFEPPFMELVPGREARLSQVRLLSDTTAATVTMTAKPRLGDTGTTDSFATLQDSGDIDCRMSGRFIRPKVKIPAGAEWNYFQGLDIPLMAGGGRR